MRSSREPVNGGDILHPASAIDSPELNAPPVEPLRSALKSNERTKNVTKVRFAELSSPESKMSGKLYGQSMKLQQSLFATSIDGVVRSSRTIDECDSMEGSVSEGYSITADGRRRVGSPARLATVTSTSEYTGPPAEDFKFVGW